MRHLALSTTAAELGFEGGDAKTVYGLVMDVGPATLVCFLTGDASLYLRPTGGFIGGFSHDSIASAAQQAVEVSATLADRMAESPEPGLPAQGVVQFITMTVGGLLVASIDEAEVGSSQFAPLWAAAQEVLTAIRLVE